MFWYYGLASSAGIIRITLSDVVVYADGLVSGAASILFTHYGW